MKKSRRRFLKLATAGAAALAAAPGAVLAETAKRTRPTRTPRPAPRPAPGAPDTATAAEIEKQKGYVQQALRTLRALPLDESVEPAFVFTPLKRRKGR